MEYSYSTNATATPATATASTARIVTWEDDSDNDSQYGNGLGIRMEVDFDDDDDDDEWTSVDLLKEAYHGILASEAKQGSFMMKQRNTESTFQNTCSNSSSKRKSFDRLEEHFSGSSTSMNASFGSKGVGTSPTTTTTTTTCPIVSFDPCAYHTMKRRLQLPSKVSPLKCVLTPYDNDDADSIMMQEEETKYDQRQQWQP